MRTSYSLPVRVPVVALVAVLALSAVCGSVLVLRFAGKRAPGPEPVRLPLPPSASPDESGGAPSPLPVQWNALRRLPRPGPRTELERREFPNPLTATALLQARSRERAPASGVRQAGGVTADPPALPPLPEPSAPPLPAVPVPSAPAPAVTPPLYPPPATTPAPAAAPTVTPVPVPPVSVSVSPAVPAPVVAPPVPGKGPIPGLAPPQPPMMTVPGVALPVAPPRLLPIRQPAPERPAPAPVPPALAAEPQEKLPEPRKLDAPPEAKVRLGRARNAVKLGDLTLAISEFEQYLALVPGDVGIREELAGVYVQAERFSQAAAAYQELLRLAPANAPRYLVAQSDLLARMKDFKGAIGLLRQVLTMLDPAVAPPRYDVAARLARTYLFDEDLPSAFAVVQQYLAALKPGDEGVPVVFVSLLLDLERAKEALPFLEPLLKAAGDNPDPELLINSVRVHAQLGDKRRALDAIELFAAKLPKSIPARLQLAEVLANQEDFDLASVVFGQIAVLQPGHVPSLLAHARMLVRQFRLSQARGLLEQVRPLTPEQVLEASLARAQYHLAAGQYTEAKYFYLDVLRQFPMDPDARVGLASVHEAARDLEKAKAEYSKVPAGSRGWRAARRGLASTLAAQRKLPLAYEVLLALQREAPWDPQTVLAYARVATRNGGAAQAAEAAGVYLSGGSPTPSSAAAVEAALGLALLQMNKVAEAEAAFRSALSASRNRSITAHHGLLRVSQRLGGGAADMGCPPEFIGDEVRYRLVMSDLSADDQDDRRALDHALAGQRIEPQNLAALVRVADLQQRLARESGVIDDAVGTAKAVLVISPTNARAHLTLARSFAIGRNFKGAAGVYQKLISLDDGYTLPKRELARVYFADNKYELSHDTYRSITAGDPDAGLRAALQSISERAPGTASLVQLLGDSRTQLAGLGPDLARLASSQTDPLVSTNILTAMADYEARMEEAKGAQLEDQAKALRGVRNRSAEGAYRALVAQEPGNLDALFDLGQVLTGLQKTRDANKVYSELLAADPAAREAAIALERNAAEMSPTSRTSVLYEDEKGRNGLANMRRFRLNELITLPIGDANEYAGFGYTLVNLAPPRVRDLNGSIASFVLQKKVGMDQLLFRTQLNYEQYASRFTNRGTGEAGFVNQGDGYTLTAFAYLENVTASAESLRQDIYRYGGRLTGEYQVDRRIDVGGLFRYAYYSDVNNMYEYNFHAAYRFTPLPRQLRLVFSTDGLFYSAQSVLGPFTGADPLNIFGTVHPYFAPSSFTYYETRLEWTHYVGRDLFGGANNLVYTAQYGLGLDNRFNSYNRFRVDVNWDVKSWLSVGIAGQYTYSPVYEFGSVFGYITIRMPYLYHL